MTTLHDLIDRWERLAETFQRPGSAFADTSEAAADARQCAADLRAALAESGWRSMADCPSDDRPVWVWRAGVEPQCLKANGALWRMLENQMPSINRWTHWAPCTPPPPPGEPA